MAELIYRQPSIVRRIGHDGHAVIEASAGTGKTFTIEHLVIDLLLSRRLLVDQTPGRDLYRESHRRIAHAHPRRAGKNPVRSARIRNLRGHGSRSGIDESGRKKLEDAFYRSIARRFSPFTAFAIAC